VPGKIRHDRFAALMPHDDRFMPEAVGCRDGKLMPEAALCLSGSHEARHGNSVVFLLSIPDSGSRLLAEGKDAVGR
jgi:hypothetical protein